MSNDQGKKQDGGPAFPWCGDLNDCPTIGLGMSLRDYFAAKAIQPFMVWALDQPHFKDYDSAAKAAAGYAKSAYLIADAMIAERTKEKE